jgi:alkaline phosphatase D
MPHPRLALSRRGFLAGAAGAAVYGLALPALARGRARPSFTHGVQSGDVDTRSGMVWARVDRPSRVTTEWSTTESFTDPVRLAPVDALPESGLAVKRLVEGLPAGEDIFYRMVAADLADIDATSELIVGRFRTAPASRRSVRFAWAGDTCGQGWGIDAVGMKTYTTIAAHDPDFFIHSGDTVYADSPMRETVELPGGEVWRNLVLTDAKRKAAETLDEFRGQWQYNLLDAHLRAMNARLPTFFQWDDHDVVNNNSPGKDLGPDPQYTVKSYPLLFARANRAFHEMTPIRRDPADPGRIYRRIAYGPLLDVFFLDLRSYRGPNNRGRQAALDDEARILGSAQLAWLMRALAASTATWKVIASDLPVGMLDWDDVGGNRYVDAFANGEDGPPLGRELELADLFRFMQAARIRNTVWVTAEVHHAAAHRYDPARAAFQDFDPFWEFVAGPIHASTFPANAFDMTFGPEVRFRKAPTRDEGPQPPSAGMQFFGLVDIDGATGQMTVRLIDRDDRELWRVTLDPEA